MLLLVFVGLCALTVPLARGRLSALADVRLRGIWILLGALAVQILIVTVIPEGPRTTYRVLHLLTYAAAAAFLIANRHLPGVWLIGLGGGLNALVITVNGGVMPASPSALATAGLPAATEGFVNSGAVAHPHLAFLGDVLAVPSWMPLHNVYSIGDVIIVAGAAVALHRICGSRLGLAMQSRAPLPH